MAEKRKERILHSLSAAGAGTAAVPLAGLLVDPIQARLTKGLTHTQPHITAEEAYDLPAKAFRKDRPVFVGAPESMPSSERYPSVPEVPPAGSGKVSLPALAHEIGHQQGGVIQRLSGLAARGLYVQPGVGKYKLPIQVSPVHAGLAAAAALPKTDKEKHKLLNFIQRHPAMFAAGMASVPLAGEAHASARALLGIKRAYGTETAKKSVVPLAKAFGTHAVSHAPAVAGLAIMSSLRDWLQKKRAAKALEKRGEAAGSGEIGRMMDRPLGGGYRMPVEWTDYPWRNSGVHLMKPRRKQADPDRTEILQSNTSTLLGVQE